MSYLIDTNVLIRAYAPVVQPPNDLKERELWRQTHPQEWRHWHQQVEAKEAIHKLKEQGESLYHTKEIRQEIWKAVQRPETEADGKGLTKEQATALIKEISRQESVKSLEKEIKEQRRDKSLAERREIKEGERKAEKEALGKAKAIIKEEKAKIEAEKTGKDRDKALKPIEKAEKDMPHVVKAEAYNLKVLTSDKDFAHYKDIIEVKHTRAVALDLKPELVKSYDGNNIKNPPREYYHNTKTYKVELASGKTAYLNIKGLEKGDKERDIVYHPDVIKKLERQGGDPNRPVNIEIKNPSNGLIPPGGKLQPSNPSPDKSPQLGASKSLSETVNPSKIAEASANAVKKTAQVSANVGEKALKTATQAAATASEKTLKTATTIATTSAKAVEKVTQAVASVTPVTKAAAKVITTPIKLTTEAVKTVKQAAQTTTTIAKGIKEELQNKNQTHKFDVRIGDKKFDAAIKAESREAAEVKLKGLLNNKEFVKELKAQKQFQQITAKDVKIKNEEKRTQTPLPPPPKPEPKQER